jgi:hypothetical protein
MENLGTRLGDGVLAYDESHMENPPEESDREKVLNPPREYDEAGGCLRDVAEVTINGIGVHEITDLMGTNKA